MREAIKLAIDGGYSSVDGMAVKKGDLEAVVSLEIKKHGSIEAILIDPLFWQCLGKALGWRRRFAVASYGTLNNVDDMLSDHPEFDGDKKEDFSLEIVIPEWKYRWHRFIDHLAEGKGVDEFFGKFLLDKEEIE